MHELVARSGMDRRILFLAVTGTMLLLAIGHLYVIPGLDRLLLGLPLWLWIHLGVVVALLGLGWLATDLAIEGRV